MLIDALEMSLLQLDYDLKHAHELRQAAFKLYASLGSTDEEIRKKVNLYRLVCTFRHACNRTHTHTLISSRTFHFLQITETENMMDRIVSGLSESSIKVRLAAVRYDVLLLPFALLQ